MRLLGLGFFAVFLAAASGGCAQGDAFAEDGCTPNDRKACSCDDGEKGWQLCRKSRSYEPCSCSSDSLNEGPPSPPSCGNGRLEPGETCDDGNDSNGDGCTAACQRGDGVEGGEACGGLRPVPIEAGVPLEGRQLLVEAPEGGERGSCGGDGKGSERVYAFVPRASGLLDLTLRPENPWLDVALYVRRGACSEASAEPEGGCQNAVSDGGEEHLIVPVEAGTPYFVFADAGRETSGEVTLVVGLDEGGGGCGGEGLDCETGFGGDCEAGRLACFENKYLVCRPVDAGCD